MPSLNKFRIFWEEEWPSARILKPYDSILVWEGKQKIERFELPQWIYNETGVRIRNPDWTPYRFPFWPKCEGDTIVFAKDRLTAIKEWYYNFDRSTILSVDEI